MKLNPRNYIPKDLKSCECVTCKFSRIRNFCSYHQEFLEIEGCSAYKDVREGNTEQYQRRDK